MLEHFLLGDEYYRRASFEEAQQYLGKEATAETNLTSGQFEILYRGPVTNLPSPARAMLLREKQAGRSYAPNVSFPPIAAASVASSFDPFLPLGTGWL